MTAALNQRAIGYACQRVEDFALVNAARPLEEKEEAATLWLEYLGLTEELKGQLAIWLDKFLGPGWDGPVLIGLALGLFVAEYLSEHPEDE